MTLDDRTDDDQPPAPSTVTQVTVGKRWKAEAAADGTVVFTDRKTRTQVEVGFDSVEAVLAFVAEVGLAGQAWAELERYAASSLDADPDLPRRDLFSEIVRAQQDAQRLGAVR